MEREKNQLPKGNYVNVSMSTPNPHTPGAVYQTWENTKTGNVVNLWTNIGGNGPQLRTLEREEKRVFKK